jgi:hypothetical protein
MLDVFYVELLSVRNSIIVFPFALYTSPFHTEYLQYASVLYYTLIQEIKVQPSKTVTCAL